MLASAATELGHTIAEQSQRQEQPLQKSMRREDSCAHQHQHRWNQEMRGAHPLAYLMNTGLSAREQPGTNR